MYTDIKYFVSPYCGPPRTGVRSLQNISSMSFYMLLKFITNAMTDSMYNTSSLSSVVFILSNDS